MKLPRQALQRMIPSPALAGSVVDTIGRTPMVELHKLRARLKLEGRLLAKLEYFNPGFSKKDRIALEMIRGARARGTCARHRRWWN